MGNRIYLASSWRNPAQPAMVASLRERGHDVYDFRHPRYGDNGFHWSEIDDDWRRWTAGAYIHALGDPIAERGFHSDFDAMKWADTCVLLLPCGRSAHLEAGWFVGNGRALHIVLGVEGLPLQGAHSFGERPCAACGDIDGCHEPARLRSFEAELMYKMASAVHASPAECFEALRQAGECDD